MAHYVYANNKNDKNKIKVSTEKLETYAFQVKKRQARRKQIKVGYELNTNLHKTDKHNKNTYTKSSTARTHERLCLSPWKCLSLSNGVGLG